MTSHLLLSTIRETLPVLFGPDGDFSGAPNFAGPVLDVGRYGSGAYRLVHSVNTYAVCFADFSPSDDLYNQALDLRIPTGAARVAGLCARVVEGDRVIYPCSDSPVTAREFLLSAFQASAAGGFDASLADDLAALFVALAPRIAALGGSRD